MHKHTHTHTHIKPFPSLVHLQMFESFSFPISSHDHDYVICDIQPEYQSWMSGSFSLEDFGLWLSSLLSAGADVLYLYNGESMGMCSERQLKEWLVEDCDLDPELLDQAESNGLIRFYDKGYAFFRTCLDSGIAEEDVVALVRFMIDHDVHDSREMSPDDWDRFVSDIDHDLDLSEIRSLMEISDECIWIPDLMDELRPLKSIMLTGGGVEECLKEVEIALQALDMPYALERQFLY